MKYKIFLLLVLYFNICYPQVVKIFEKTNKIYGYPSLDPFSGTYTYHLDSLYVITPDGQLIKSERFIKDSSRVYDVFIDTLTSIVVGENTTGLAKYKIVENRVEVFWDSIYNLTIPGVIDVINKIFLKKEANWILKKFHWEGNNYLMKEDSTIGIVEVPTINYQPAWLGGVKNWSIFRLTSFFYEEGSIIVAVNINTYKIKYLKIVPGGPMVSNYAVVWERVDLNNYASIRLLIDENEEDINFKILDTVFYTLNPIGSIGSIEMNSYWGIDTFDSIKIIDNNNKVLFEIVGSKSDPTFFANVVYYPPKNFLLVNAVTNVFDRKKWSGYFINRLLMIIFSTSNYNNPYLSPFNFNLYQNYPNPFNSTTTIEFDTPERTNVKLVVYDILGREVETLIDKELEPGKYKVNFEAKDLPSGVYFYTLRTPKFTKTKKMILIK